MSIEIPPCSPSPTDAVQNGGHPRDRGRFTPGNQEARKHGLNSQHLPAEVRAVIEDAAAFADRSMADAGGRVNLGARAASLHAYRGIVHQRIQEMHYALETHGLFDRRGRLRVAWLSKLESLMATARSLDNQLGLDRQPKTLNTTPSQWLAGRAQQENTNGNSEG